MPLKQFKTTSIHYMEDGGPYRWYFTCAMVSTCSPIFDDCEDNYAVEDKLRRAGVIAEDDVSDSESCQMFVNFRSQAQAVAFIGRLNEYLQKKATMMREALEF